MVALHGMQAWPPGHEWQTSRSASRTCSGLYEPPASQCPLAAWVATALAPATARRRARDHW